MPNLRVQIPPALLCDAIHKCNFRQIFGKTPRNKEIIMRDKILFLIIGILITSLTISIVKFPTNLNADENIKTFESVKIKGSLTIGEGENQILLKSNNDRCDILILSKESAVSISAKPDTSTLLLLGDIKELEGNLKGIMLNSDVSTNKHDAFIRIKDDKGEKYLNSK